MHARRTERVTAGSELAGSDIPPRSVFIRARTWVHTAKAERLRPTTTKLRSSPERCVVMARLPDTFLNMSATIIVWMLERLALLMGNGGYWAFGHDGGNVFRPDVANG